jgi:hypothetical protein
MDSPAFPEAPRSRVVAIISDAEYAQGMALTAQLDAIDANLATLMAALNQQRAVLQVKKNSWWSAIITKYELRHKEALFINRMAPCQIVEVPYAALGLAPDPDGGPTPHD